ncbi:6-phosphofructokinase [Caldibacillus debilis]|uniref:6-phosphofructokinase n=1 Tax=Caldibacillus debilis TaxID=301148 RepID=UPI0023EF7361|nr:6-phosphofructokinase [Caldibacillus debilis]
MVKVAVITSGGDGSGVNAAITMISKDKNINLFGFHDGFDGILKNDPIPLKMANIQHYNLDGKQILRTSRSKLPYTKEGREKIQKRLKSYGFEYLLIFGGNGSQKAAKLMNKEGTKILFIPMTIDNDVEGSEYSIGFDTALNRIIEVIHDLHDTAHNMPGRIFMVEVLGGKCGNLALASAIAGGCDLAIIPEFPSDKEKIASIVSEKLNEKETIIIVCSESAYDDREYKAGNQGVSFEISDYIEKKINIRVRKTIVGFYIRSGNTSFRDAFIASQMGALARECINNGISGKMIGVKYGLVQLIDFHDNHSPIQQLDPHLVNIAIKNNMIINQ